MASSTVPITAELGRETGSAAAGRLRAEGKVPAVVYGHGSDPVSVAVDHRELDLALNTEAGRNVIFELAIDGAPMTAVAHIIDRHPTKNRIIHIDFLLVDLDEEVTVDIPVRVEGEGPGVKEQDGVVELIRQSVHIRAVVTNIPREVVVDGSGLEVGDVVHIRDLPPIEGVEFLEDEDLTVLTVSYSRAALEEEEPEAVEGEPLLVGEEAEEPAEGEAGEAESEGDGDEG